MNKTTQLLHLLLSGFLFLLVMNVEVLQLVRVLVGRDNTQPITELLLLQVLLSQIFEVPLGERRLSRNEEPCLLPGDPDS